MAVDTLYNEILKFVRENQRENGVSAGSITANMPADSRHSRPTVNRALISLVSKGLLRRSGGGRSVVYHLAQTAGGHTQAPAPQFYPSFQIEEPLPTYGQGTELGALTWSQPSLALKAYLGQSLGARAPVSYQKSFVENYTPNVSSLLPTSLANALFTRGKSKANLPAGTYARKVLEQLLIDLSWSSSKLEGNNKSLLDTRELFEKGASGQMDWDSVMLLNHKEAIEFMVDTVPTEGITTQVVRNLQSILMRDLLSEPAQLGSIRSTLVHIDGSVYRPHQVPAFLEQMLSVIIQKGRCIKNPVEGAFFLWVNLAYLQPFIDGNKRTSRLASNMPLLLANCAPLSFLNVEPADYALAMMGIYEKLNTAIAVDLFEHTYNRSILAYKAVQDSLEAPLPLRARYRDQISDLVSQVVYHGLTLKSAAIPNTVPESDIGPLLAMVEEDLLTLEAYNCSRFRLPVTITVAWIERGRPY